MSDRQTQAIACTRVDRHGNIVTWPARDGICYTTDAPRSFNNWIIIDYGLGVVAVIVLAGVLYWIFFRRQPPGDRP